MSGPRTALERAFPIGRWRADWIWAADAPRGARHAVALQTSFELDEVPTFVPARWCAISRVTLYVNGVEIGRGPVRSNPRTQPADDADLTPFLRRGRNTVAALVTSYAGSTPWYLHMPEAANDLAHGAFVFEARAGAQWITSDTTWRAATLHGWGIGGTAGEFSGRSMETIDANACPADWTTTELGWPDAVVQDSQTFGEPGARKPPSYPIGRPPNGPIG